jgi:hypothetical protein
MLHNFETTDAIHIMHCKRSQFSGKTTELPLAGPSIIGVVYSIVEAKNDLGQPKKWIVTFIPKTLPTESVRKGRLRSRW